MPQGLCVVYATLIWSSREAEVGLMFAGQMACEALNWGLKRLIKEERPRRTFPKFLRILHTLLSPSTHPVSLPPARR